MVGGAPAFENQFLGGELVLKKLLKDLDADCLGQVTLSNSDVDSLEKCPEVAAELVALAKKMNEANK